MPKMLSLCQELSKFKAGETSHIPRKQSTIREKPQDEAHFK